MILLHSGGEAADKLRSLPVDAEMEVTASRESLFQFGDSHKYAQYSMCPDCVLSGSEVPEHRAESLARDVKFPFARCSSPSGKT